MQSLPFRKRRATKNHKVQFSPEAPSPTPLNIPFIYYYIVVIVSRAVVVLGAGVYNNGEPTKTSKSRVDRAFEYLNKEDTLILCGGHTNPNTSLSEAEAMKDYAQLRGIDNAKILMETRSIDTVGNAYYLKGLIGDSNSLTVVTSKEHVPRAKYIFHKIIGKSKKIDFIEADSIINIDRSRDPQLVEKVWYIVDRIRLAPLSEKTQNAVGLLMHLYDFLPARLTASKNLSK